MIEEEQYAIIVKDENLNAVDLAARVRLFFKAKLPINSNREEFFEGFARQLLSWRAQGLRPETKRLCQMLHEIYWIPAKRDPSVEITVQSIEAELNETARRLNKKDLSK